MSERLAIFAEGLFQQHSGKTGHGVIRYGTREVPEIDAYRWTRRAEVPDLCGKNMTRVLMALEW